MLGIIAGVVLVLTRGRGAAVAVWSPQTTPAGHTWAIVAGLLGALGQGLGLVLSKMADTTAGGAPLHSVSMTLVRMVAGLGGVLVLLALRGATRRSPARRRPMTGSAFLVGALLGPILGVWLSMYAVQQAAGTGRAAVLIALTPVLMIPISLVVYRERPGLLSWAGTLLAFAGTAGLMLGSSV
jgi:drug/metabolite transporter (DMT)-like permease